MGNKMVKSTGEYTPSYPSNFHDKSSGPKSCHGSFCGNIVFQAHNDLGCRMEDERNPQNLSFLAITYHVRL